VIEWKQVGNLSVRLLGPTPGAPPPTTSRGVQSDSRAAVQGHTIKDRHKFYSLTTIKSRSNSEAIAKARRRLPDLNH
jgi:hypothetical protein